LLLVAPELPSCVACGACCFSRLETYARIGGDDYDRLGAAAERLTRWTDNRCYLRIARGRCAALDVDGEHGEFRCTIYEQRPDICRNLERGSAQCLAERAAKVDRAMAAMRRARQSRVPRARPQH
jgi:Fe-S-cluster containining protein